MLSRYGKSESAEYPGRIIVHLMQSWWLFFFPFFEFLLLFLSSTIYSLHSEHIVIRSIIDAIFRQDSFDS
jgi:hypothetical protein